MHELSIAMSIVDMAGEEAAQRGGVRVDSVHLKIGALAGVVKAALLSSWELAREGTGLENCALVIEEVPVVGYCPACRAPRQLDSIQWMACPECKAPMAEIVSGRELEVVALEIVELEAAEAPI
jgi:hydrogenase nickel incorporation protein HypA/HybF